MSLVVSPNDTIYESIPLNITCTATLTNVIKTNISATASWISPNKKIINTTNDSHVTVLPAKMIGINTFESVLIFYPVDNSDEGPFDDQGEYTCEMTISSTDNFILIGINSITENVIIQGNNNNNNNNIECY